MPPNLLRGPRQIPTILQDPSTRMNRGARGSRPGPKASPPHPTNSAPHPMGRRSQAKTSSLLNVPVMTIGMFTCDIEVLKIEQPSFFKDGAFSFKNGVEAFVEAKFKGLVYLPTPGTWKVGLVQNIYWQLINREYSRGGQKLVVTNESLLDVPFGAKEIWFESTEPLERLGGGRINRGTFQTIIVTDPPSGTHKLDFDPIGDVPGGGGDIPGVETRCDHTITEYLVKAEREINFKCALVAQKDNTFFQLALSDSYGYSWKLEIPPGASRPDDNFFLKEMVPTEKTSCAATVRPSEVEVAQRKRSY
jgi:hypothetical protein